MAPPLQKVHCPTSETDMGMNALISYDKRYRQSAMEIWKRESLILLCYGKEVTSELGVDNGERIGESYFR